MGVGCLCPLSAPLCCLHLHFKFGLFQCIAMCISLLWCGIDWIIPRGWLFLLLGVYCSKCPDACMSVDLVLWLNSIMYSCTILQKKSNHAQHHSSTEACWCGLMQRAWSCAKLQPEHDSEKMVAERDCRIRLSTPPERYACVDILVAEHDDQI